MKTERRLVRIDIEVIAPPSGAGVDVFERSHRVRHADARLTFNNKTLGASSRL
jgi:hypothetical protein